MKQIKEVSEKVYVNEDLRKSVVPLFIGNPGLGKSHIIYDFAKEKGVNLIELITSQMSPFEISGICIPDKDTKQMMYYNLDRLDNLKDGDILFFDELLNGNPVVLNACLTMLEQRKLISGKDLPNILIIAAANPQGMTPLTPQIKERFIWYDVKFDKDMWGEYIVNKYQISNIMVNKLVSLINKEEFKANNFYTPRSIDKAINMIIKDVPTPYSDVITPILSELIENKSGERIEREGWKTMEVGEIATWLSLKQNKKEI